MQQPPPPGTRAPPGIALPPPPNLGRQRKWLPAFAAFGLILVVVFGGYVTAGALSVRTGEPVRVAGAVRLFPVSGWQTAGRFTDPPGVRLTRGNANLDLWVLEGFGGSADDLARVYEDQALSAEADRLSASEPVGQASPGPGLTAVRFSYVGVFGRGESPVEGEVTAIVSSSGLGVVVDGWAAEGSLDRALGDIHQMIESLEIG